MHSINLLAHLQTRETTSQEDFALYAKIECQSFGKVTKPWEEEDLASFCHLFKRGYLFYENWFYNFKIEQISKEFDLLRIGKDYIINVELKHDATIEKITKQLLQNRYYLAFLQTPIHSFTYIAKTNQLYSLSDDHVEVCDPGILETLITRQRIRHVRDLNMLFRPDLFLVNPLVETEKFLKAQYFLTDQQKMIENEIVKYLEEETYHFFAISGDYGTGKTLLLYDLARLLMKEHQVTVLHCAKANQGIARLKQDGYQIYCLNELHTMSFTQTKILIVDEAQRLSNKNRLDLINTLNKKGIIGIFAYDPHGYFSDLKQDFTFLEDNGELHSFNLTHRIRTNKVMANFISALFDQKRYNHTLNYSPVHMVHMTARNDARSYTRYLSSLGYVEISGDHLEDHYFYDEEKNIITQEDIIGKDFEKVVVTLDEHYYYDEEGRLRRDDEHSLYVLYQGITRVRSSLMIIVLNNQPLFQKGLAILGEAYE